MMYKGQTVLDCLVSLYTYFPIICYHQHSIKQICDVCINQRCATGLVMTNRNQPRQYRAAKL